MALEKDKLAKKKLGGMAMPVKKSAEIEFDLAPEAGDEEEEGHDLPELEEGSAEEEAMESPKEEAAELEHVPDEALLAEIKKRGLTKQLDKAEPASEAGEGDDELYPRA